VPEWLVGLTFVRYQASAIVQGTSSRMESVRAGLVASSYDLGIVQQVQSSE